MEFTRSDRVSHLIKRVVAEMLTKEVKDPRIGMITITDVTVSKDLRHAHIYYTMFGSEKERNDSAIGLKKATKFIQGELGRRVQLRYTPIIDFRYDESFEYGTKIDRILHEISTTEDHLTKEEGEDSVKNRG